MKSTTNKGRSDHHPPPHLLLQGINLKHPIRPPAAHNVTIASQGFLLIKLFLRLSHSVSQSLCSALPWVFSCGTKLIVSGVIWLFCGFTVISVWRSVWSTYTHLNNFIITIINTENIDFPISFVLCMISHLLLKFDQISNSAFVEELNQK